jgi:hypothetical protein
MKPLVENDWPRLIRPGCRVFIGGGAAVPLALVESMLRHADAFKDVVNRVRPRILTSSVISRFKVADKLSPATE